MLPVGGSPNDYEEIIVPLGRRRLSLLIVVLINQGNDRKYDHAELKEFSPCNHACHPLSFDREQKEVITPEWIRGKPPTGVLVAPQAAHHRIRQIASKNCELSYS